MVFLTYQTVVTVAEVTRVDGVMLLYLKFVESVLNELGRLRLGLTLYGSCIRRRNNAPDIGASRQPASTIRCSAKVLERCNVVR